MSAAEPSSPPQREATAVEETQKTSVEETPSQSNGTTADPAPAATAATDAEVAAITTPEEPLPPPPPRPETPTRIRELRASIEAAKARVAEQEKAAQEKEQELAAKRERAVIQADIDDATSKAAAADEASDALRKRQEQAAASLNVARSLAARVQRLRNYQQRITSWIDTEFTRDTNESTAAALSEADKEVVVAIRQLRKERDDEAARVNAMLAEHSENNKLLVTHHSDPNDHLSRSYRSEPRSPQKAIGDNEKSGQVDESPARPSTSSRRWVSSSPGTVRHNNVDPLPAQPSATEVAAFDLEAYVTMNNEARVELQRAQQARENKKKLRVELTKSLQNTKRMIEKEIQSLTYKQNELAHQLQARRKRVVELEMSNSSLASSLQYASASLKMLWTKPVEDYMIASRSSATPKAAGGNSNGNGGRQAQRKSTTPAS